MNNIHAYLVVVSVFWALLSNQLELLKNLSPFNKNFRCEFGAKDNSISIDKKDYLIKESQPVELDEEIRA